MLAVLNALIATHIWMKPVHASYEMARLTASVITFGECIVLYYLVLVEASERLIANLLVGMIFVLGLGMCFGNWKQTGVVYCFLN